MRIDVQARQFPLTESLKRAIETEAQHFKREFAGRPTSMTVRLFDANGAKGGVDKGCLVFVHTGGQTGPVVASGLDSDLYQAIAAAFARLSRGTRHALDRNRRAYRHLRMNP
jgi:ribosome-associated translation inhibitor RaiA